MRAQSHGVGLRAAAAGDLARLHQINEASTPGVGSLSEAEFARLVALSPATLVAEVANAANDTRIAGFIVCLAEGSAYASLNYAWIAARYQRFAYVDRIAVAPEMRGSAVGQALYAAAIAWARGRRPVMLCEVNLAPPNPGSLRFHERLGFRAVGERWSDGGAKGVVYLEIAV